MSLVLTGRLVPITTRTSVAKSESASFRGRVWIADDGTIAAVTTTRKRSLPGFESASRVDVGNALVLPGFIDLHSHLAYATLPLWVDESRATPFAHHNSWPSRPSYPEQVTWPAYAFITASPAELLAYAEVRALIGGTTSIQGSPPSNRPLDGWLVRNVEDETLGRTVSSTRILSSTLTLKAQVLGTRAGQMRSGAMFIYHCAEGQRGSLVSREFEAVRVAGCLQPNLVAIHTNALDPASYASWSAPGTIVWSPFSNLWLYGDTTDVPAARSRNIKVCIGSDWAPSGMRNVLGELKVARVVSDARNWGLSDFELVKMITANPGDALAAAWGKPVGRIEPGALADLVVIAAPRRADPFARVVRATERDVRLVVIRGQPLFGTPDLMQGAGASGTSALTVGGEARAVTLTRFDDGGGAWSFDEVLERMEEVRADPRKEIDAARMQAHAGAVAGEPPRLRLALDMPTGVVPVGGLPKDLSRIVVPAIQPLEHDDAFFAQIAGRGFHGGLLDAVADFYS